MLQKVTAELSSDRAVPPTPHSRMKIRAHWLYLAIPEGWCVHLPTLNAWESSAYAELGLQQRKRAISSLEPLGRARYIKCLSCLLTLGQAVPVSFLSQAVTLPSALVNSSTEGLKNHKNKLRKIKNDELRKIEVIENRYSGSKRT